MAGRPGGREAASNFYTSSATLYFEQSFHGDLYWATKQSEAYSAFILKDLLLPSMFDKQYILQSV